MSLSGADTRRCGHEFHNYIRPFRVIMVFCACLFVLIGVEIQSWDNFIVYLLRNARWVEWFLLGHVSFPRVAFLLF